MLSSTLFSKFPTIGYNGETVTNIAVRLKFAKMVEDNIYVFYPYTIKEGERADVIAHNYYGDASYSWLIYLANNIFSPLEDWPRTEEQFQRYVQTTYGSLEKAYEKIMFYRVEWASDDSMLSQSAYNALPQSLKKYWVPEYNNMRQVLRYTRSPDDWVIDTNKIVKLSTSLVGDAPSIGAYIYQLTSSEKTASGEVIRVDGLDVYVKHVIGEFVGAAKTLYVEDVAIGTCVDASVQSSPFQSAVYSDVNGNPALSVIPAIWTAEENYWTPVTAYEYEAELNEAKKTIRLIDASYLDVIERDIRMILTP